MRRLTAQLQAISFKPLAISVLLITYCLLLSPAYAATATLSVSPTSGTFNRGCNFTISLLLNTGGAQTDGTDAIIFYDPSRIKATSITPGTIYSDYPGNSVDEANGKIIVSGLASVASGFAGTGTLATVNFTVMDLAQTDTATLLKFDFDPADKTKTTDSNVVERGTIADILGSVTSGSYNISDGSCGVSTQTKTPVGATGDDLANQKQTVDEIVGGKPGVSLPTTILGVVGGVLTVVGFLGMWLI